MPTDPKDSVLRDPLPEVPLPELIERARHLAEITRTRGELMAALRARGLTWRQIETQTGIPIASAHRWWRDYLDGK